MTGIEALNQLEEGYILRRKAWESDLKCRAYFLKDNKTIPEHVPDNPEFTSYLSVFDCLDNGDFFEDDWEIIDEIL